MDPEISRVLRDVVDALDALAIPYAIGGSVASSVYGEPRSTHDIDVQVALHEPHLGPLLARLDRDYVISEELARSALANFSSFQALHKQLFLKVDLARVGLDALLRRALVESGLGGPA